MNRKQIRSASLVLGLAFFAGCGGGGAPGGGLQNKNPGANDLNVVVAFGDSITNGSECECDPYPRRLAPLIGKSVLNTGVSATRAIGNVERTQQAIDKYHPAFLLILYGINDLIHGAQVGSVLEALDQMIAICKDNDVVPVIATYALPIGDRIGFAERTLQLNAGIRDLARTQDIECVDLEAEFDSQPELYDDDGLHPNDAGTQVIAMAFADLF